MSSVEFEATDAYEAGVLKIAYDICTIGLARSCDEPDLLYLRGLILARDREHRGGGVACLRRAVALMPSRSDFWLALNLLLVDDERYYEALAAALSALRRAPDSPQIYVHLARTLRRQSRFREALAAYREAIRLAPGRASLYFELADALREQGAAHAAVTAAETGRLRAPLSAQGHYCLGLAHLESGNHVEAVACFQAAVRLDELMADAHLGLGRAYDGLGDRRSAIESFRLALACDPFHDGASRFLTEALRHSSSDEWAKGSTTHHRGMVLLKHRRYEEAYSTLRQAVTLGKEARSAAALAHACLATSRPEEALALTGAISRILPDDSAIHVDLATANHLLGNHEEGWEEFRWLYDSQTLRRRGLDRPLWDGSPLGGRTILLWTDMGRGDVIQFLRYIPEVKARGGRVLVHCNHTGLIPLVERVAGVDGVFTSRSAVPHHDVQAPLVCLPAFVRICRHSPAHIPYLSIEPRLKEVWRERLGTYSGLTVGLSWGGNTSTSSAPSRFLALNSLGVLASVPDARYVSLQHGPQTSELFAPPNGLRVAQIMQNDSSIDDAAALVTLVDLVISVDSMIAHLSGALGKPVWTLLRRATNWRWRAAGTTTMWYPTMRLFRQSQDGDWMSVIADVHNALRITAKTHRSTH